MLHLLRYILGDDTFFRTLSTFLHQNEFKSVDTHDFMKTVKEVAVKTWIGSSSNISSVPATLFLK